MLKEDAKKYLERAILNEILYCGLTLTEASYFCEAHGMARRALDANQSWISIKDTLPELITDDIIDCSKDVYILMVDDNDAGHWKYYQVVGCYTSDGWYYYTYSTPERWMEKIPYRVTHWMPIIERPA